MLSTFCLRIFVSLTFVFVIMSSGQVQAQLDNVKSQDKWEIADKSLNRLSPDKFVQLPKNIRVSLKRRGCKIPQSYYSSKPHNVISGRFIRRGQDDWAVLCSRNGTSVILVFWGGKTSSTSSIASLPDRVFLQSLQEGEVGYSRLISPVNRKQILKHYQHPKIPKPPPIYHKGIDDAYLEKGSTIHYFYRGRWLQLMGAD